MPSKTACWLQITGCLLVLALSIEAARAAPVASTHGLVSHSVMVRFRDLPRRYSCDDLQRRLRDALLPLGAPPDINIRVSECGDGWEGYSPQAQIEFTTPSPLLGEAAVPAGFDPASRTVRLAPGQLSSWQPGDCALMRQLKDKLLPQLSVKIVAFSLACSAPAINSEHYRVIVQAPRASSSPAKVAAVGAATRPLAGVNATSPALQEANHGQ